MNGTVVDLKAKQEVERKEEYRDLPSVELVLSGSQRPESLT